MKFVLRNLSIDSSGVLDVVKFTARNMNVFIVLKLNGRHQLVFFPDYVNL